MSLILPTESNIVKLIDNKNRQDLLSFAQVLVNQCTYAMKKT